MQPIQATEAKTMWVNVHLFSSEELANIRLSDSAKQYMMQVGLPERVALLFSLIDLAPVTIPGFGPGVALGLAWDEEYQIDVSSTTGAVYAVRLLGGDVTAVNSGLEQYVAFLYWVTNLFRANQAMEVGNIDHLTYNQQLSGTIARLNSIDAPAVAAGAWWTKILEDFKLQ